LGAPYCAPTHNHKPQTTTGPTTPTHNHHDEVRKNGIPYALGLTRSMHIAGIVLEIGIHMSYVRYTFSQKGLKPVSRCRVFYGKLQQIGGKKSQLSNHHRYNRNNVHLRVLISKAIHSDFLHNNIEVGPDAIQGQCLCPKTTSTLTPSL